MNDTSFLPRILIIDDLFGRTHPDRRNEERANLCGQYLIEDVTGDEIGKGTPQKIKKPIAQVVFYRGQKPICSTLGDIVENDPEGTLRVIRSGWEESQPNKPRWAMVLLDLCFHSGPVTEESNRKTLGMPEGREGDDDPRRYFGLQILELLRQTSPDLPAVILSSKSRNEVSLEFSSKGALGFLPRGDEGSSEALKDYILKHGLIPDESGEIIGYSKSILLSLRAARLAAKNRKNVLLLGERGTGKELFAGYISRHRPEAASQFVIVNSAELTPELFASALFGIEDRTATGVKRRIGLIEEANGGDLFFDEVKDMSPLIQAAILRAIEQREIARQGSEDRKIHVDVRFLSATNVDLERMALEGSFRPDLLDRLRDGGTVYLPPLRERKEDLPLLVEEFVRDAEHHLAGALKRQIEPDAVQMLQGYDWPGNIRELKTCIFRAVNENPDVEHLVPVHIHLPNELILRSTRSVPGLQTKTQTNANSGIASGSFEELIDRIERYQFDSNDRSGLAGKLTRLRRACAGLLSRYLAAALAATAKATPENPEGEIQITPPIKLMRGDKTVTTSQACDEVKRLLKESPELTDPVLKRSHEYVLSLRPRKPKPRDKQ